MHNRYVYIKIEKRMYLFRQAAMLAYKQVHSSLTEQSYCSILSSMGLWNHPEGDILFNLCANDFGIKYFNQENVQHLINTLSNYTK